MPEFTHAELKDIQGTILSGFAHLRYASYLFLQIKDPARAKVWLAQIAPQVTTGELWEKMPNGFRQKPPVTLNLGITYQGFEALDLPEEALQSFPLEFKLGMTARSRILGDTGDCAPQQWEIGGPNTEAVHLILILNAANEETIEAARQQQRALLKESQGGVVEVNEQHGHRPASEKEHFGFRDGIAQPKFQRMRGHPEKNKKVVATGEFILGYDNEFDDYASGPCLFTKNDPANLLPAFPGNALPECKDFGRHGTYMVYRKLIQDVASFWNFMAAHARRGPDGSPDPQNVIHLAAKCVGRWPSGAPLVRAPEKDNPDLGRNPSENDRFLYFETDPDGYACPIGSHLRRSNPRDSMVENTSEEADEASRQHRIIRRSVSFGPPLLPLEEPVFAAPLNLKDDGQERGLHFFGIGASISRQYEFVQNAWCNEATFNGLDNNKDPLIGNNNGTSHMTIPAKPVRTQIPNLPRFVTVRGGAYFFLPSLTTLRFLVQR